MCLQQQISQSSQPSAESGSTYLLQGLPDLFSTLEAEFKSGDEAVLKVMKQSMQSRTAKHLSDIQPFLGVLIDHFCKTEKRVSLPFI